MNNHSLSFVFPECLLVDTLFPLSDPAKSDLLSFPNVIVTGHQAFFTEEAITTICQTTIESVSEFAEGRLLSNEIKAG